MPTSSTPKRAYLTDATIRDLPPPTDRREEIVWDGPDPAIPGSKAFVIVGFGLRHMRTGHKSFHFDCRLKDGSGIKCRTRIGRWPRVKADAARKKALELQQLVERGGDPTEKKRKALTKATTMNDLADMFEREHMVVKTATGTGLRSSTAVNYRSLLRLYVRPRFGRRRIGDIGKDEIKKLHREISTTGGRKNNGAAYQANRVLMLLTTMYNFAIDDKKLLPKGANPCVEVEANKERSRRRYLSDEELVSVKAALDQHPDSQCVAALRLLMWTGARRGEVLTMKWEDLELHRPVRGDDGNVRELAVWDRKAVDMKGDEDSAVPLADAARRLLVRLHVEQGEPKAGYVFPSAKSKTGHLVEIAKVWSQIVKTAGITKSLRLHDLRHSFASFLISEGVPLEVIGPLMGHSSLKTTARYAHLKDGPQRNAVEKVAKLIAGDSAEIIPGPGRRNII
jgi:integrase